MAIVVRCSSMETATDRAAPELVRAEFIRGSRLSAIEFHNSTHLSSRDLLALCRKGMAGWCVGSIALYVRYSRGADFSGSCYYADRRIFVNLGRHLVYPYRMATHIARAKGAGRYWFKPTCTVEMSSGIQVVMFVFMHELYHLLVKRARRNTRQKESMCDRFATRFVVEQFGAVVRGADNKPLPRNVWDFQDLDGFVAAARDRRMIRRPRAGSIRAGQGIDSKQLLLFPV